MKSGTKSLVRVETLINNDRIRTSDGFSDLLKMDLSNVLRDYFDYKGEPVVRIMKSGNKFQFSLELTASGIKGFKRLPKDGDF